MPVLNKLSVTSQRQQLMLSETSYKRQNMKPILIRKSKNKQFLTLWTMQLRLPTLRESLKWLIGENHLANLMIFRLELINAMSVKLLMIKQMLENFSLCGSAKFPQPRLPSTLPVNALILTLNMYQLVNILSTWMLLLQTQKLWCAQIFCFSETQNCST